MPLLLARRYTPEFSLGGGQAPPSEGAGWAQISSNVCQDITLPEVTHGNRINFMEAWSGGDFDPRSRMLFCLGGGDGDYDGNEVMAFSTVTGLWSLFWGNTPAPVPDSSVRAYADGSPSSRHTYSGITIVQTWGTAGGLFLWGGIVYHTPGVGTATGFPDCWMLDLATKTWTALPDAPIGSGMGATASCTDGRYLYIVGVQQVSKLDTQNVNGGWSLLVDGPTGGSEVANSFVYHPVVNKLICAGSTAGGSVLNPPAVWDPVTGDGDQLPSSDAWQGLSAPGLAADPLLPVVYTYDGTTVWSVDVNTGAATALAEGGTATPTALNEQGTFGRFRLDGRRLILVNKISEPVFAYQLGAPLDLTAGTFYALASPNVGVGLSPQNGCKHVTVTPHPPSGRLYMHNGDYSGAYNPGTQSYEQYTWSWDLATRWAAPSDASAGWTMEYPYEGYGGSSVQPKHPDFCGFAWDPGRGVFWMVPGQMYFVGSGDPPNETGLGQSDANFIYNDVMTFNPTAAASSRWTALGIGTGPDPSETWMSVYDPLRDRLIRTGYSGGSGTVLNILDCSTATWLSHITYSSPFDSVRINKEYLAVDYATRRIYAIDGTNGHLYRISLDTYAMEDLGLCAAGAYGVENYQYVTWDSTHGVLLHWSIGGDSNPSGAYAYHPTTGQWETLSVVTSPADLFFEVRAACYDPAHDVHLLFGGVDIPNPYFFLYRYAPA